MTEQIGIVMGVTDTSCVVTFGDRRATFDTSKVQVTKGDVVSTADGYISVNHGAPMVQEKLEAVRREGDNIVLPYGHMVRALTGSDFSRWELWSMADGIQIYVQPRHRFEDVRTVSSTDSVYIKPVTIIPTLLKSGVLYDYICMRDGKTEYSEDDEIFDEDSISFGKYPLVVSELSSIPEEPGYYYAGNNMYIHERIVEFFRHHITVVEAEPEQPVNVYKKKGWGMT